MNFFNDEDVEVRLEALKLDFKIKEIFQDKKFVLLSE